MKIKISLAFLFVFSEIFLQWFFRSRGWGIVNSGVSFGLFKNFPISLLVIIIFLFWGLASIGNRQENGWKMVLLGGVTNLLARVVFLGVVWDYLTVPGLSIWFNGADLLISAGVLTAIVEQFRNDHG